MTVIDLTRKAEKSTSRLAERYRKAKSDRQLNVTVQLQGLAQHFGLDDRMPEGAYWTPAAEIMRSISETEDPITRAQMAVQLMPYCHFKIKEPAEVSDSEQHEYEEAAQMLALIREANGDLSEGQADLFTLTQHADYDEAMEECRREEEPETPD